MTHGEGGAIIGPRVIQITPPDMSSLLRAALGLGGALLLVLAWCGSDARAQVVIRERVEVTPGLAGDEPVRTVAGQGGAYVIHGLLDASSASAPLSAPVSVTTTSGAAYSGNASAGFSLVETTIDDATCAFPITSYWYDAVPEAEVLRISLAEGEKIRRITVTRPDGSDHTIYDEPNGGLPQGGISGWLSYGCSGAGGVQQHCECCEETQGADNVTFQLGARYAPTPVVWPDELRVEFDDDDLACGETTVVRATAWGAGQERPLTDDTIIRLTLPNATFAELAWGGATGASLDVPTGRCRPDTLPCARGCGGLTAGVSVELRVETIGSQPYLFEAATMTVGGPGHPCYGGCPLPLAHFGVAAALDTVLVGGTSRVVLTPRDADGNAITLDAATLVWLGLEPEGPPSFSGSGEHPWGRLVHVAGGDTTGVDVSAAQAWGALSAAPLYYLADGEVPAEAVEVEVSAEVAGRPETRGSDDLVLAAPAARLLRQDDTEVTDDYLMVSRFVTNDRLGSAGFSSGFTTVAEDPVLAGTGGGDRFTFRPEVSNVERCNKVEFRLRVLRDGTPIRFRPGDGQEQEGGDEYYEYDARGDGNAPGVCRGNQFIRLVSNAPPEVASQIPTNAPSDYDDEYEDERTVRVQLGDVVQVTTAFDGVEDATSAVEKRVGQEPEVTGSPDAVRTVAVNWSERSGLSSAADVVTARMSEDLAQAAVAFEQTGTTAAYREVQDVLRLRILAALPSQNYETWRSLIGGTVRVRVTLSDGTAFDASYTYAAGVRLDNIATGLRRSMIDQSGGRLSVGLPDVLGNTAICYDESEPFAAFVLVERGAAAMSFGPPIGVGEVALELFLVDYQHLYGSMTQAAAMNHRDDDLLTMDAIVVEPDAIWKDATNDHKLWGASFPYEGDDEGSGGILTSVNATLLDARAADALDDFPYVAGHEAGHLLLGEAYPGHDPADNTHHPDPTNLLFAGADEDDVERYDYHKRLTKAQVDHLRARHEPEDPGQSLPTYPRLFQRRSAQNLLPPDPHAEMTPPGAVGAGPASND